ncbi:MAG: hypothetical protein SAJ37_00815 [Oscillatoria sp. PMC 1068.18]|nr:hypothetical protein [Oscillatoria sp. PMC 1076.18]MEC4987262.1 hypothetical protein [Oscillatoria sp. PMC 1068.18]
MPELFNLPDTLVQFMSTNFALGDPFSAFFSYLIKVVHGFDNFRDR